MRGALVAFTFLIAAFALNRAPASRALARSSRGAVTVLVATSVADRARSTMPPARWARFVAAWAGPASAPFGEEGAPDAAGCRKAGGDVLIVAPFDVRDELPGLPNATERFAGRSQIVVLDCNAAAVLFEGSVRFDGEPVAPEAAGTAEAIEAAWARSVPGALARIRIGVARIARIRRLEGGGGVAYLELALGALRRGDVVQDAVRPSRQARRPPVALAVTREGRAAEATFAPPGQGTDIPAAGDLVELQETTTPN